MTLDRFNIHYVIVMDLRRLCMDQMVQLKMMFFLPPAYYHHYGHLRYNINVVVVIIIIIMLPSSSSLCFLTALFTE